MDFTQILQTNDLGHILLIAFAAAIVFLWRQNQWLTKQLLKVAVDNTVVMTNLLAEMRLDPQKRLDMSKNLGPNKDDPYGGKQ